MVPKHDMRRAGASKDIRAHDCGGGVCEPGGTLEVVVDVEDGS